MNFLGQAALPDTGVDVSEYLTLGITGLGAVALTAVGGYVAFLLIKKGLKWGGKALS